MMGQERPSTHIWTYFSMVLYRERELGGRRWSGLLLVIAQKIEQRKEEICVPV